MIKDQTNDLLPIHRTLISVSDKTDLDRFCLTLIQNQVEIFATTGTAEYLKSSANISVQSVESLTEFPEMMHGRVKTLHPKIFGGILARREKSQDCLEAQKFSIPLFDLVIVNLYPFHEYLGQPQSLQADFLDIGGPALIRAAAKNCASVVILSHPNQYSRFLEEFQNHNQKTRKKFRLTLAKEAFQRTASYDAMIANEWGKTEEFQFPEFLSLPPQIELRYGENPHQKARWCQDQKTTWRFLQGKELSYNNLLDSEAATRLLQEFEEPAVVIVKHGNPCGVASENLSLPTLIESAIAMDPQSAFGGIVACNQKIDEKGAQVLTSLFLEVILAPEVTKEAQAIFQSKKNLRVLEWQLHSKEPKEIDFFELRRALGGWLMQTIDTIETQQDLSTWKTVTKTPIQKEWILDLQFAWKISKHVHSNAVVIVGEKKILGIGAGQTSRVASTKIALEQKKEKQKQPFFQTKTTVLASDAFFPFRDSIDSLRDAGIQAIIQPGGSQRDAEVIAACDELGIAMIFTGKRHFRH